MTEPETDQYDSVLRAMEEGLLISINNEPSGAVPSDELRVERSSETETDVTLTGPFESHWKIHRGRDGSLRYSEMTSDGLSYEDEVITLEIIGIDE